MDLAEEGRELAARLPERVTGERLGREVASFFDRVFAAKGSFFAAIREEDDLYPVR